MALNDKEESSLQVLYTIKELGEAKCFIAMEIE